MHTRAAWVITVLIACLACAAPAGAAQVTGSLQVTETTATTVSFTVTAQRLCGTDDQCDYYADLEEFDGEGPCPTTYPADPWNVWNGDVLNTGPSTETGTITPRRWLSKTPVGPSRLCLFIFADNAYYYVDGTTIRRPGDALPPTPTTTAPGSTKPGTSGTSTTPTPGGTASNPKMTCARYAYQQTAQKALEADPTLAARLDRNGNGIACQGVPKHKNYVRTVAMATAKTSARAALRRAYGTAFTAGTGYRARCARRSRTRVRCAVTWQRKGTWKGSVEVVGALRKNEPVVVTRVDVRRP